MRFPFALVLVLAAMSCGRRSPSLDAELAEAQRLLYSERFDLAFSKATSGLERAEKSGAQAHRWRFRLTLLDVLLGQRRLEDAEAFLRGVGEVPHGPEWAEVRGRLLLARGRVLYARNRDAAATEVLGQAAELAARSNSEALAAEVSLRQGLLLIREQKLDEARARFESVSETASRLQNVYLEAIALGNVGFVLQQQRRYEEAVPWFEQTVRLFSEFGASESVARNNGNLAACYWGLGDYDNAQRLFRITEEGFAKTGNRDSQQIWIGNAANVRYEVGDYAGAEASYRRALDLARSVGNQARAGLWLANLAATSIELGRWDAAAAANTEAQTTLQTAGDNQWDPLLTVNAARIAEGRGDPGTARTLFEAAIRRSGDDAASRLDAHAGLARLHTREGRVREAEAEFQSTVAMIEAGRRSLVKDEYKVSYLASLMRFRREYVEFLIASHRNERALEVADSSRARLLEERSGSRVIGTAHSAADYRRVARQMRASLFEYLLGPERSYLWVVEPAGIQLHLLPGRDQLRPLIESYRAVVTGGRNPLDSAGDTGRRLYNMLLAPGVRGAGRFVLVPDQDLYSFNLETLPNAGTPGKFWVEDATVTIAPSLNYLSTRISGTSGGSRALLAIGDATGATAQYPRLQYAGQELADIAARVGGSGTTVLRGDAATPAAYLTAQPGRFGFIHFAAHAAANQQNPLDSAVILSGPTAQNRLLARDVMATPLTAELVTISACRSAGGKTYAGEGLVGFAWAFLRAGARNVIAGLWDVSDRSTAQLMTTLYGRIAQGAAPAEALREAKLQLIHGGGAYAKPFYWAPFQVYVGRAE
ncbi:MAG: Tetratricopeptide 2 repeat protein [Bryobacterales bacterium]|nr:Tetratricopeptide 2 repeat protein [Bryobacterales bacterium]